MLHIINKSPFENNSLLSCLRVAGVAKGHAILFIEDGVYGVTQGTAVEKSVSDAMANMAVYALNPDLEARGAQGRVMGGVKLVDYDGFVDLVAEHDNVQSWL